MPFRLAIEDGRFATTLEVSGADVTAGTAPQCGLRLASEGVARRHAIFRQCGKRVVVEDLGARSGVELGGKRVDRALLTVGETVRIGGARISVAQVTPVERGGAVLPASPRRRRRGRRTTPVLVSAAIHTSLLAILWTCVIGPSVAPEEEDRPIAIDMLAASRPERPEPEPPPPPPVDEKTPRDALGSDKAPVDFSIPETPFVAQDPGLPEPLKHEPEPPPGADTDPPEPTDAVLRGTVGVGTGSDTSGSLPASFGRRSFGKGEAGSANRTAAGMLETMGGGETLRAAREGGTDVNVWVLRGDYDQAEKVLDALQIAHAVLGKDDLETREIPATVKVLFYNCTGRAMSPEAQRRIALWVSNGGWLVSTDWGVERLLEKGFPGTVVPLRSGDRPVLTKDETVAVKPATGGGLGAGTGGSDVPARWWLEDSSVPFTMAEGLGAEVLVRSEDLQRRHGEDASAVAVSFPYGRGRVLHMLGHVFQQEGNLRGAVIVHRIVVNFVAGALAPR